MSSVSERTVATISPAALFEKHQRGETVELIDVRTPAEYREVHATIARPEPLDRLDAAAIANARSSAPGEPLYVICLSGNRGKTACERLLAAGLTNIVNVEGGTRAWEAAGLPVVRGKRTISLERQVRIAAGSLVLLGTILGAFVHPYFLGLAGFVGAGLVFAGITDTCGMGMMLAKMPWNQASLDPPSCSRT